MEVSLEVVSRETIKPSSPTQLHRYDLSFLDQISPPVYNPLVLFYASNNDTKLDPVDISNRLKTSLSDSLTLFYPLAGRLQNNLFMDCNDEGVPFLEAKVKCKLSDVVLTPNPKELNKFVPFVLDEHDDKAFGVQFNIFECGGIAIGVCLSHKLADGLSLFNFIRSWTAISRGEENIVCPEFISAKLFPPKNISGFEPSTGITRENIKSKRFEFKSVMIDRIKERYAKMMNSEHQRPPSRVEALSTFIWNRFISSTEVDPNPEKIYFLLHAVNLRTKFDPPLPENSFGNLYRVAMTFLPPDAEESCDLVTKVRETISKIDKNYIEKLKDGDDHLEFIKQSAESFHKGEMINLNFTSLCRFPVYGADFGWGRPTWVGSPALAFNNLVVFMDNKSLDGIEVYIHLKEENMSRLENDKEFLEFLDSPTI